jgi:hypothetical protein
MEEDNSKEYKSGSWWNYGVFFYWLDKCAACHQAHTNFANESADNVWNEGN